MTDTIFPVLSLDNKVVNWAEYLDVLTPCELVEGMWFKRDDKFAPLGYGGINGSKLRQLIMLVQRFRHAHGADAKGLISGASVKSPQLSMSTAVARHFGMGAVQVIGATNPDSMLKHENVAIAARLGARFQIINVAYNPALQRQVMRLAEANPKAYHLYYGISPHDTDADVSEFHFLGAKQVANLPDVETLVLPAGSCNSAVSVMYGLAQQKRKLKVLLVGIGPNRQRFMLERIELLERANGLDIKSYLDQCSYVDLHASGVTYQDEVKWAWGDINFHPTYEGKVMRYLETHRRDLLNEKTCVWIIGSRGSWANMEPVLGPMEPVVELVA